MPDPAVPAPRPLTAEEFARIKAQAHDAEDAGRSWSELGRSFIATVEELQAEVRSLGTRLAATTTTLRTVLGTDEDWQIEPWPEEYEGNKASLRRTCVCDLSDVLKGQGHCWCCDTVNLTADEAAVLDAIRDNHDA